LSQDFRQGQGVSLSTSRTSAHSFRLSGRRAPGTRSGVPEGKELEIIKLDRKRNNVVVSRRAVVESEHSEERDQLLERLQENAVVKGVVKNLTDYGAFVDLGGIDGLLHITDMAWKRVRHPSEVVNVGDELEVRVLRFDRERNRVASVSNSSAKIRGWRSAAAIRPARACSARFRT
jgi:ribosomal protein S1